MSKTEPLTLADFQPSAEALVEMSGADVSVDDLTKIGLDTAQFEISRETPFGLQRRTAIAEGVKEMAKEVGMPFEDGINL